MEVDTVSLDCIKQDDGEDVVIEKRLSAAEGQAQFCEWTCFDPFTMLASCPCRASVFLERSVPSAHRPLTSTPPIS